MVRIDPLEFLFDKRSSNIRILNVSMDGSAPCRNLKNALEELSGIFPSVKIHNYDLHDHTQLKDMLLEMGIEDVPYVVIASKDLMLWTKGAGNHSEERKRYMVVFEGLEKGNYRYDDETQTIKIWDGEGNQEFFKGTKL